SRSGAPTRRRFTPRPRLDFPLPSGCGKVRASGSREKAMTVARWEFGTHEGGAVEAFRLESGGIAATLIGLGARLQALTVPDRDGAPADVVLGADDVAAYAGPHRYSGAVCGRYGNRIAGARFPLGGRVVTLDANEPP